MRYILAGVLLLAGSWSGKLQAQGAAPSALVSPAEATPSPSKKEATAETKKKQPTVPGGNFLAASSQPVTTEIYSNEADFNSKEYVGTFTGQVIVKDPRFNLQADKLTVYLARGKQSGLEKAIAEGNVAMVRDAPGEAGAAPVRTVGRADRAVYTTNDGNVELSGTPRVQSGLNTHVATSPETVMVINQSGQLTTRGPSRTEIRQEPSPDPKAQAPPKP
ncbi:MAG: LptA/OstA family protein [Chthoniobacterales bacterium]